MDLLAIGCNFGTCPLFSGLCKEPLARSGQNKGYVGPRGAASRLAQ